MLVNSDSIIDIKTFPFAVGFRVGLSIYGDSFLSERFDDLKQRRVGAGCESDHRENHQPDVLPHNPVEPAEVVGIKNADFHDGGESEAENA